MDQIGQELVRPKPVVLCILDGFGIAPPGEGNAVSMAEMPNYNKILQIYPSIPIQASGDYVGLRWGEVGNSEVGHLNIGAGEIVYQSLPRINKLISTGEFFENKVLIDAIERARKGGSLHIMGLCSSGGVHSHTDHLNALIDMCVDKGLKNFFVHMFLDGRDTPFNSGIDFVRAVGVKCKEVGAGSIATVTGRFFAMDRDNRWDRTEKAYNAIAYGKAEQMSISPEKAIEDFYAQNIFDEQIPPIVITDKNGQPLTKVQEGDTIIFINFRADRARQLTKAFVLPSFSSFERPEFFKDLMFVTMMEYEKGLPVIVALEPNEITNPLGKIISDAGLKQLRISETEKYAHVTFFFNGGREEVFLGEDRVVIPSPKVASYADEPGMSCEQLTDRIISEIAKNYYDLIVVNYANPDMVGHTGNLKATIEALEILDWQLGKLIDTALSVGGVVVITADHGNCEQKLNFQTNEISKEHSTSPVPLVIIGKEYQNMTMISGGVSDLSTVQPVGVLADIAPTILKIMKLRQPESMTGTPLI